MKYNWKDENSQVKHFYRLDDGKVLGTTWQYVNNNLIWCSKILKEDFPFTDQCEQHLGRYIDQNSAKRAIEEHWNMEDNTFLENKSKGVIDAT